MTGVRRKNQGMYLLLWIGIGITAATIGANRVFASGLVDYRLLYQYLQQGWQDTANGDWKSVCRILLIRVAQTAVIEFLCRSRIHRLTVPLLLVWAGCGAGLSLVLMTWQQGVLGLFVFLVSIFPHQIFYGAAWGILLIKCLSGYEAGRRRFWGAVTALLLFGILMEVHVNARLLSLFSFCG